MPNRKTKKNANRRSRQQQKGVSPFGTHPLLSAARRVKLAYAERVVLTEPAAGAGISTSFSLNGVYDPNSGGLGLQPVGFDQISAMYGQYKVWSVTAKLSVQNGSGGNMPIVFSMFGTHQPAVPSNPDAWVCQPYGTSRTIEPLGGRSGAVITRKFDIPAVLGLTKPQYTNDMDFVGTPSGNPARQAYLMLGLRSMGNTVGAAFIYVQLEYLVEFMQPFALNLS